MCLRMLVQWKGQQAMKNQNKRRSAKAKPKPCGKLNPADYFNLTKEQAREFREAAFKDEQQNKKDFQVGGVMDFTMDFKIGEAGISLDSVKKLLSPAR